MHLEENVSIAPFTTLRIGGPARYLVRIPSEAELTEAIRFARAEKLPIFTLGGGSNLVVPDEGYPGVVLKMELPETIEISRGGAATEAKVSAGTDWDALVLRLCQEGLAGMECLAGIPGLVGGAPIQNIGAYGQEVAQTIASVRALDLQTLRFVQLSKQECGFAYRTSIFNSTERNRYIVTEVTFWLEPEAKANLSYADLRKHFGAEAQPAPLEVYEAVRQIRDGKGMLIDAADPSADTRSAGSFFKNPIVRENKLGDIALIVGLAEAEIPHWPAGAGRIKLPAAWLIERAGFPKGFAQAPGSPVGISTRHTLALINRSGSATYRDLQQLATLITIQVEYLFNISLEQEPVTLK